MRWPVRIQVPCLVASLVAGAAETKPPDPPPVASSALDLSRFELRLVYSNDFTQPQKIAREEDFIERSSNGTWQRKGRPDPDAEWIAEGWGGVEIREGKLRVAPSPFEASGQPRPVESRQRSHMVVWCQRVLPPDFLLEFEMSPCGSTNGLAIVLLCGIGQRGEDLFDLSLPPRRADYQTYHSGAIANYTDSYWSRNTEAESLSNRLRKNPGFKEVASDGSLTTGGTDVTHRIRILKHGGHIEVEINGRIVLRWDDTDKPLGAGRIGLRSMEGVTMITYDNFKAWQITEKPEAAPPK